MVVQTNLIKSAMIMLLRIQEYEEQYIFLLKGELRYCGKR